MTKYVTLNCDEDIRCKQQEAKELVESTRDTVDAIGLSNTVNIDQCGCNYVLAKSHGQAEQGSYLVAHSCACLLYTSPSPRD